MDTSETYIKMCEQAEEIQNQRPSGTDEHDYFFCPAHGFGCDLDRAVWLPRQDELQKMVRKKLPCERLFWRFRRWWDSQIVKGEREEDNSMCNNNLDYESFEQLWLAFVMFELYHKKWDGTAWISVREVVSQIRG